MAQQKSQNYWADMFISLYNGDEYEQGPLPHLSAVWLWLPVYLDFVTQPGTSLRLFFV